MTEDSPGPGEEGSLEVQDELLEVVLGSEEKRSRFNSFILAALGSVPWVGGFLGAAAAYDAEKARGRTNRWHERWLEEHERKIGELSEALGEIISRVDQLGEEAEERLEDPSYLKLVRQGFRTWDAAATEEKKKLVQRLLTNAAGSALCDDDVVRLFLDWIDHYHEAHFAVIRQVYRNRGITRGKIWDAIHGSRPRDDSAEADLFKLLMRDLSTGGVIRQHRPTDASGRFLAKKRRPAKRPKGVLKSPFDEVEPYELTQLGQQFVHYAMDEVAPRLEGSAS